MKITKKNLSEFVRKQLATNTTWAIKALVKIYGFQTREEQNLQSTMFYNGIGFTGSDAPILTSLAQYYLKHGFLSVKQLNIVLDKIPKYHGQILSISDRAKLTELYLNQ